MSITKQQLKAWLGQPAPETDLGAQIRQSPSALALRDVLRRAVPALTPIAATTYTLYREFEHTGARDGYQYVYFARRSQLTRAVFETLLGDNSLRGYIHDLLWAICEETTWVLPAHEEQGPDYWDIDPPVVRNTALGAHTMLTREPASIDLFAAETGASLAETVYLLGDLLAPEVRQRVRQEVERRIFKPYLAHGRKHWWYKGALNWNGVCNGSIGLAFLRLEHDIETLAEALTQVLEGLEAYIATGFEADGGSVEGVGYWNYGLMYYVTLAEALREQTAGQFDLLAAPRLHAIARYPVGMSLSPNHYINPGDAKEALIIAPGIAQRLAERTGVAELRGLVVAVDELDSSGVATAKLAIMLRNAAWWDGQTAPFPEPRDFFLPDCGIIKLVGQTAQGQPVVLAAIAGHNDGHHSHTDVGVCILHIDGESLLCDPGQGLYSKEYFRQGRYDNPFNNSYAHSVPRIGGTLQAPGPEFGGCKQFYGTIVGHGERDGSKFAQIEMHHAYDLPQLRLARRTLRLDPQTGETLLEDVFAFDGAALAIEEVFVTWDSVAVNGGTAQITGARSSLELTIQEPAGAVFQATRLEEACRANQRERTLTRLTATLPNGTQRVRILLKPETF
ncbi:MAG: heparinase II/III family protein [Chloroflexales bacterium]|nr:heparinase II/III family protein [Chloroflexales bacterium]